MPAEPTPDAPKNRLLRAFAFDPSLTVQFATSSINEVEIEIPWNFDDQGKPKPMKSEQGAWIEGGLEIGPENEYVKVIDFDPASGQTYPRVDLNHPALVYSAGLPPSEKNPQFHQQMVFAVAMKSIHHFEEALGRKVLWAPLVPRNAQGDIVGEKLYGLQMLIYPHGMREENAFYSPSTLSVLFGYFKASGGDADGSGAPHAPAEAEAKVPRKSLPRVGMVYSCLSHGIVAHEMTHALLDGVHPGFNNRTNNDVDAFHEAFADLVALFQHFTYPNLLRHQIAQTQGDLRKHNLLGMLAYDFGQATGRPGALRDALGTVIDGEWVPKSADPTELGRTLEPHARGSILVAAVFDAFRTIYESRIRDLQRIATGGTGKLPAGDIHPDLVNRMTTEATNTARHFLNLCIRALDYCPPVDLTFGDYMRSLITADHDYFPTDERNYRTAIIESFRKYGVYPRDVRSLLIDGLLWLPPRNIDKALWKEVVEKMSFRPEKHDNRGSTDDIRLRQILDMKKYIRRITEYIRKSVRQGARDPRVVKYWSDCLYLALDPQSLDKHKTVRKKGRYPLFDVQSVRFSNRVGESSDIRGDVIIQIVQNRDGYLDPAAQEAADAGKRFPQPDFTFPGGCTIILDAEQAAPRFVIAKGVLSQPRLEEMRAHFRRQKELELQKGSKQDAFFGISRRKLQQTEPFALLHRISDKTEIEPWQ